MKTVHFTIRRVCLLVFSLVCLQMFAQQRVITGTVISSEDGEPLIGAAIAVLGHESQGAITDIDDEHCHAARCRGYGRSCSDGVW